MVDSHRRDSRRVLMKGNEAIAESAIQNGCLHFFGYPITPQTEVAAYMAKRMPEVGGVFLQAESEVAAINMVYGASGAGARAMTSSSSPGISLKAEGISYIAATDLPCLIVNVVRAGPGLGGILAAQSDYFQAVKGCGHGDYKMIVLAPSSVQEIVDLVGLGFDLSDKYRVPTMLLADGMLGQMMEPVMLSKKTSKKVTAKNWATTGTALKRKKNIINSLHIQPEILNNIIVKRFERYKKIEENEARAFTENLEDADVVLVAYGIVARIARSAMNVAREQGIKVGLIRPITLWPFPVNVFQNLKTKALISVEMSMGQMIEDVKLAVNCSIPVYFYGKTGGLVLQQHEIVDKIKKVLESLKCGSYRKDEGNDYL